LEHLTIEIFSVDNGAFVKHQTFGFLLELSWKICCFFHNWNIFSSQTQCRYSKTVSLHVPRCNSLSFRTPETCGCHITVCSYCRLLTRKCCSDCAGTEMKLNVWKCVTCL